MERMSDYGRAGKEGKKYKEEDTEGKEKNL
jgi:hypothetical protein